MLPPVSWAFEPGVVHVRLRSGERARALLDEAGYPDPDGDGPAPRFRLTLKVSNIEFNRLQSAVIQQNLRARRHRARRPDLRVRDAVRRRPQGQLPAVHAAVGRRRARRSRHPAPRLPLVAGAAGRLQPRATSAIRRVDALLDEAAVAPTTTQRRAAVRARCSGSIAERGALHQPLVQDQRRRRAAHADRRSPAADRRLRLPQRCRAHGACSRLLISLARRACRRASRPARRHVRSGAPVPDAADRALRHLLPSGRGAPGRRGWRRSPKRRGARCEPPLGVRRRARTHVVLADQTELANGWATPLPYNTIVIYRRVAARVGVHRQHRRLAAARLHPRVHAHRPPRSIRGLGAGRPRRVRPDADRVSRICSCRPGRSKGWRPTRRAPSPDRAGCTPATSARSSGEAARARRAASRSTASTAA